jgi:hypothetical protein
MIALAFLSQQDFNFPSEKIKILLSQESKGNHNFFKVDAISEHVKV